MRNINILFFLFVSLNSFGQLSDTTCIKTRWIAVQKSPELLPLFDSTIITIIRENVLTKKMNIYRNSHETKNNGVWYKIPDEEYFLSNDKLDTFSTTYLHDYFEIEVMADGPLTDEFGDPVVVINPDGTISYKYPPPKIYQIRISDINEIRIREERIYDSIAKEYTFKATGLSFFMKKRGENFWISLDELYLVMPKDKIYEWKTILTQRLYSGFQYMQISCYNNLLRE